jgi:hypothetical protein
MRLFPQWIARLGTFRLVVAVPGRNDTGYKTVFPHQTFVDGYIARMFLYEQGLVSQVPTRRHSIHRVWKVE